MISLEKICQLNEKQIFYLLEEFLQRNYDKVTVDETYLIAEGTIPIVLIAHLDTVFSSLPANFFHDQKQKVKWGLGGAGFDDRAGVWAIMRAVLDGYRPHIIFTTGEEIGGVGASAVAAKPMPFTEAHFLVELDRQGRKDCVFYDCGNKEFQTFIESFGFETAVGTFSDISIIAPAWDVAAVNLSIGYLYEHTASELFYEDWFEEIYSKLKCLLESETKSYDYQPLKQSFLIKCPCCNRTYPLSMMIGVQYSKEKELYLCDDCFVEVEPQLDWCEECGEPFFATTPRKKCYHCEKEGKMN